MTPGKKEQPQDPDGLQESENMQSLKAAYPDTYRIFSELQNLVKSHNGKPHHIDIAEPEPIPRQHKKIDQNNPKTTAKQIQEALDNYNLHTYAKDHIVFIRSNLQNHLGRVLLRLRTHEIISHSILTVDELTTVLNQSAVWRIARPSRNTSAWKLSTPEPDGTAPAWLIEKAYRMQPDELPYLNIYDIDTGKETIRRRPARTGRRKNVC